MASVPESDLHSPEVGSPTESLDGVLGGFPILRRTGSQLREKTAIRKLEGTIAFLRAELAGEARAKEDAAAALTKSEEAYRQLQLDAVKALEEAEARHAVTERESRRAHTAALEALTAEVRPCRLPLGSISLGVCISKRNVPLPPQLRRCEAKCDRLQAAAHDASAQAVEAKAKEILAQGRTETLSRELEVMKARAKAWFDTVEADKAIVAEEKSCVLPHARVWRGAC